MSEKTRLIKRRRQPLALPSKPSNPVCSELITKFKDELRRAQNEALEKEKAKEDSLLNMVEEDEEIVQDEKQRIRFKAKQGVVKRYGNGVLEFHRYLKNNYNSELTGRTLWEPPMWLRQFPFWKRLEKGKFKDVYGYLHEHILPPYRKDTKALIQRAGGRCWEGGDLPANEEDKQHAIVRVDWEEMGKELERSIGGLRKYPPAFAGAGILKTLPQKIERGEIVYAIGYHGGYYNKRKGRWGYKLYRYLKEDKAIREGLERMKLPR
jgi:hypothetical protein